MARLNRRGQASALFLALVRSASAFTPPAQSLAAPLPLLHSRARSSTSHTRHNSWPGLVASAASDSDGDLSAAAAVSGGDELVAALSADGSISVKAVSTTELVAETSRLQGLGGLACAALGRAITCSILVADGVKDEETFQVNFRGDGPLRGVLALCNGRLEARGYVGNPAVTLPPNALGKFDVGAGVGKGTLQVVRTKNLPGEEVSSPYTSFTEIKTGESERQPPATTHHPPPTTHHPPPTSPTHQPHRTARLSCRQLSLTTPAPLLMHSRVMNSRALPVVRPTLQFRRTSTGTLRTQSSGRAPSPPASLCRARTRASTGTARSSAAQR
jgi:hypothetical protein